MLTGEDDRAVQVECAVVDGGDGTAAPGTADDDRARAAVGRDDDRVVVIGDCGVIRDEGDGLRTGRGVAEGDWGDLPTGIDEALDVAAADGGGSCVGMGDAVEVDPAGTGVDRDRAAAADDIAGCEDGGGGQRSVHAGEGELAVVRDGPGGESACVAGSVADLEGTLIDEGGTGGRVGSCEDEFSGTCLHEVLGTAEGGGEDGISGGVVLVNDEFIAGCVDRAILDGDCGGSDGWGDEDSALRQGAGAAAEVDRGISGAVEAGGGSRGAWGDGDGAGWDIKVSGSGAVA